MNAPGHTSAKADSHPYLRMKAAIAWELLAAMAADGGLRQLLSRARQTIDFTAVANLKLDDRSVILEAKASSGLPVTFELVSGPAKVDGSRVLLNGNVGIVRVRARQDGNRAIHPAPPVERAFAIGDAWPKPTSDLAASPLTTDTIRLQWEDHADDETGCRIEVSSDV